MAGERRFNDVRYRKECTNYYSLFLIGPIIMIGPGGLQLVVPHLFAIPVSVLWVELQKNK